MDVVHKMVNTNIIKTKYYAAAKTIPIMNGRSLLINTNNIWFVSSEEKSKHERVKSCAHTFIIKTKIYN